MAQINLTDRDRERMREYLRVVGELEKTDPEPPMFADEEHDTEPTEEWEAWNKRGVELTKEYSDVMRLAITQYVAAQLEEAEHIPDEVQVRGVPITTLIRRILRGDYQRKDSGNVSITSIQLMTGPITNALMARNEGHITPRSYFENGGVEVNTGAGGHVMVDVTADSSVAVNSPYREYQLTDRDRFWLDPLYTLAIEEGRTEVYGSEILKLRGYANPYDDSAASAMADAAASIDKASATRLWIDVTEERRNKRKGRGKLIQAMAPTGVVDGKVILETLEEETEDGKTRRVRDFCVKLNARNPEDSLPIAKYERTRGMFTTAIKSDFTFTSVRKLTTDDRQMWSYVLRIIKAKRLSGTILFETMWRNLELREPEISPYAYLDRQKRPLDRPLRDGGKPIPEAEAELATEEELERRRNEAVRRQHDRMLKKLEKMLNEKQALKKKGAERDAAILQKWEYVTNKSTGSVEGLKITRLRDEKKN